MLLLAVVQSGAQYFVQRCFGECDDAESTTAITANSDEHAATDEESDRHPQRRDDEPDPEPRLSRSMTGTIVAATTITHAVRRRDDTPMAQPTMNQMSSSDSVFAQKLV